MPRRFRENPPSMDPRASGGSSPPPAALIGRSPIFEAALARLEDAARVDRSVLLLGERGTGKELFARRLHALRVARGRTGAFIAVNCGTLSRELHLSQLFGHRRGAFTGALEDHPGYFGAAEGGTLFLDEVAELPPEAQIALLRPLQERRLMRVGETTERPFDVLIVAATHQDLEARVAEGRFRADLLDRLRGRVIQLPPLRERGEDVLFIASHLLETDPNLRVYGPKRLAADARDVLLRYRWPGNVRELGPVLDAAIRPELDEIGAEALRAVLPAPDPPLPSPLPVDERVLRALTQRGTARRGDLARELRLPESTVKRALAQLHDRGHVERMERGRATWYRLSEAAPATTPPDARIEAALALAARAGRVSRATLARETGGCERTLSRALARACALGLLVPDGRAGSAAGYVLPGETRLVTGVTREPGERPVRGEPGARREPEGGELSPEQQDGCVLAALERGPLSCEAVAQVLGQSPRTASRVLNRLEQGGTVARSRAGRCVVYRLVTS